MTTLRDIALKWSRGEIDDGNARRLAARIPRYHEYPPEDQYEDDATDDALPGNSYDDVNNLAIDGDLTVRQTSEFIALVDPILGSKAESIH